MKHSWVNSLFILTLFNTFSLAEGAQEKETYKEAIQKYEQLIEESPQQKSELLLKSAVCYVKDQELERGLQVFLESLKALPQKEGSLTVTPQYERALNLYLNEEELVSKASEIQREFQNYYQEHKSDTGVGFILAASYAQLADYPKFMETFYRCYSQDSNHYMVARTFGMVHLKLVKFAQTSIAKEEHTREAYQAFKRALHQNPKDALLFRLTLVLSSTEERPTLIKENLKLILEEDTMLTRMDIYAYVRQSLSYGYSDLTKKLLEKARVCYPESRTLDAAEKYFEQFQIKQGG